MSETIVVITAVEGSVDRDTNSLIGPWDITLQILRSGMTYEEAHTAFREGRQYKLVEVFDKELL